MAARLRLLSTLPPPPIPPLLNRVFEYVTKDMLPQERRMYMLRAGGGVVGVVGVGGVGLYYLYKYPERMMLGGNENIVLRAFEEGRGLNSFQGEDGLATVQRSELRKGLLELLHPASSEQYAVIVGGTGTGKSTAVRQALQSLDEPVGALYFMTPETIDTFSTDLATLLGYEHHVFDLEGGARRWASNTTREEGKPAASEEPRATWKKLRSVLMTVADKYKQKHQRSPTLIIDAADKLAKDDPAFLALLQDFAKDCADRGTLRVVFMSSDGVTLPLLMGRSAWSRALEAYEVSELDDADAVSFLKSRDVNEEVAMDAVATITGGRFASLNKFVSRWQKDSNAVIRDQMDVATDASLMRAGIASNHALFRRLVDDKRLKINAAIAIMQSDQLDVLVEKNVVCVHTDGTYGFQSRQVTTFFENVFAEEKTKSTTAASACMLGVGALWAVARLAT